MIHAALALLIWFVCMKKHGPFYSRAHYTCVGIGSQEDTCIQIYIEGLNIDQKGYRHG